MGGLRCPKCGRHVVRRTHRSGVFERLLSRVSVYPFRCQLCGRRFRAIQPGRRWVAQAPERREFDRLVARVPGGLSAGTLASEGAVTQISMEGCTLETDAVLPVGTVLQVRLHLPDARALEVDEAVVRWRRGALRSADFWFVVAVLIFIVVSLVILFPEVKFCPRGRPC